MSQKSDQGNLTSFLDRTQVFFRRSEQPLIVALIVASLVGIGFYVWNQSRIHNGVVDIDEAPKQTAAFQVDVNSADWPELANLPGIGEIIAKSIIQHREINGPFISNESLIDVDGIGPNKLAKIERFLLPFDSSTIANRLSE